MQRQSPTFYKQSNILAILFFNHFVGKTGGENVCDDPLLLGKAVYAQPWAEKQANVLPESQSIKCDGCLHWTVWLMISTFAIVLSFKYNG